MADEKIKKDQKDSQKALTYIQKVQIYVEYCPFKWSRGKSVITNHFLSCNQ